MKKEIRKVKERERDRESDLQKNRKRERQTICRREKGKEGARAW